MKIGLVLPGFSADESDWCIPALRDFVCRLAASNSVHVFALEYPYRRDAYSVCGAAVHSLNGRNRGRRYAPRLWLDALGSIRAEHRRAPFDILHAFWANEPGSMAVVAGRWLRVPAVVSIAGGELVGLRQIGYGGQLKGIERTMVSWTICAANYVTVGSRYLERLTKSRRADAQVLPLGVDVRRFSPREPDWTARPTKVLNVASLLPVKGQRELLRAFAQLAQPDAGLEIIGEGGLARELREESTRLGIADRVAMCGAIPHQRLAQKYHEARLLVQSSLHESQGMAVLEAAACGTPIAATPVGIAPELAEEGAAMAATGFGAGELVTAMEAGLQAGPRLGFRAREIVERDFSWEATWHKWTDLYRRAQRGE